MGSSGSPASAEAAVKGAKDDLCAARREYLFRPPATLQSFLFSLLNDPRDEPLLLALFNITVCVMPSSALLFLLPSSHWLGALHFAATYVIWGARFILAFHYSSHRSLFKKDYRLLNHWTEWVMAPFFGIPCGVYQVHHCVMHHGEDNGDLDISSTEAFQRDNILHFLCYWARFLFLGGIELPLYCVKKRRWELLAKVVSGVLSWVVVVSKLYRWQPIPTLWSFIIPYVFSSFLLMFGNWSQHIFVDPAQPENDYTLTYNCVAHADNQQTFNDGYHVIHHLNSRVHWSEMPQKFIDTIDQHGREGALTFKGIGFFEVGAGCMLGRLGWLADHVVPNDSNPKSKAELVALFKERLKPVKRGKLGKQQ